LTVVPESRSWCYILEAYGLDKGDFSKAQKLIGDCRKAGLLPVDIVASDERRATSGDFCDRDWRTPEDFAADVVNDLKHCWLDYRPLSPYAYQDCYVEVVVEKGDIAKLFLEATREFYAPITPMRGWADINSRADLIGRLQRQSHKRCVVLCCTDLDPGGLRIADFLRENLAALEGATGWRPDDIEIVRFGLDADFVEAHGLSWIDNLETSSGGRLDDPKHPDHRKPYVQDYLRRFGARKVELQALMANPRAARELVRAAISPYFDPDGIEQYESDLKQARDMVRLAIPAAVELLVESMGGGYEG
jgi:hypothetical protein